MNRSIRFYYVGKDSLDILLKKYKRKEIIKNE